VGAATAALVGGREGGSRTGDLCAGHVGLAGGAPAWYCALILFRWRRLYVEEALSAPSADIVRSKKTRPAPFALCLLGENRGRGLVEGVSTRDTGYQMSLIDTSRSLSLAFGTALPAPKGTLPIARVRATIRRFLANVGKFKLNLVHSCRHF
jgi:hypothetical protein